MEWIEIKKDLPKYYECVFAELTTGETVEVWRATDGEYNIWTKFGTNEVFFDDDIVKWKRHKLEYKTLANYLDKRESSKKYKDMKIIEAQDKPEVISNALTASINESVEFQEWLIELMTKYLGIPKKMFESEEKPEPKGKWYRICKWFNKIKVLKNRFD